MTMHSMQGLKIAAGALALACTSMPAEAHKLREKAQTVQVAEGFSVTPTRDWNRLNGNRGKATETWTLDGDQLNELTFYGGIEAGRSLLRERSKNTDPLPKFEANTLVVEVPELLEGTYRTSRGTSDFAVTGLEPGRFLGTDGVAFTYQYVDGERLVRKGEARAAIIGGKLFMITFEAPRLHYFDQGVGEFRKISDSARRP